MTAQTQQADPSMMRELDLDEPPPSYTATTQKPRPFEMNQANDAAYQGEASKGNKEQFWKSIAICGICLSCINTTLFCCSFLS